VADPVGGTVPTRSGSISTDSISTDSISTDRIEIPGPWLHRHVAANGARFHVAQAGPASGPLVVLLHGFPELWWAWRHQLTPLAEAGFRAVAMDLRGYGGSDKTPVGYDPVTLAQDVSGVVKSLGARHAVLVGHGWGGYVGWATAALHPHQVSALCAVSAPHPLAMRRALRHSGRAGRHLLAMQVPLRPERRLARADSGFLARHLRSWSAPGSTFPSDADVATYQRAIGMWPASHCALEYHRWLVRSQVRADGRRFTRAMRPALRQPVCCVTGEEDRVVTPLTVGRSDAWVTGDLVEHRMPGVGHFPHEEDPAVFTGLLLSWLGRSSAAP
jgi:pimeloyl-ACP methyl ester carboxylesterase